MSLHVALAVMGLVAVPACSIAVPYYGASTGGSSSQHVAEKPLTAI